MWGVDPLADRDIGPPVCAMVVYTLAHHTAGDQQDLDDPSTGGGVT